MNQLKHKDLVEYSKSGRKKIYSLTPDGKVKISQLLKEKQEVLFRNLEVVKQFGEVVGKKQIEPVIRFINLLGQKPSYLIGYCTQITALQKSVLMLFKSKDIDKKRARFKKIIERTVKEIDELRKRKS